MNDQKIENLLNLSLDATEAERKKSESLDVGYNAADRTWQVIVRYHGDLTKAARSGWIITTLTGGYAIVRVPQTEINLLASLPEIEYVEKPKLLYFSVDQGRTSSCVSALQSVQYTLSGTPEYPASQSDLRLQTPQYNLWGAGVLVAVIDSGVDYFHPDFRNEDGSSRILALWDQTACNSDVLSPPDNRTNPSAGPLPDSSVPGALPTGPFPELSILEQSPSRPLTDSPSPESHTQTFSYAPPTGFSQGIEYTKEMIDAALAAGSRTAALQIVPECDASGHGTGALGIAAGNGMASGGRYRGMAPKADLLVVKLGNPEEGGFPRTAEVMQAVEYVIRKAQELDMPAAINLSFGNTYGSHRGTSLLETYLNMMADRWKTVIAVGTGNEGNSAGHFSAKLKNRAGLRGPANSRTSNGSDFPLQTQTPTRTRTSDRIQNPAESDFPLQTQTPARIRTSDGIQPQTASGANSLSGTDGLLTVEFAISDYEPTMNLQLWKNYADEFLITLIHPNGETTGPFGRQNSSEVLRYRLGNTELLVYCGQPSPYQGLQEIYFEFLPAEVYLDAGIWKLIIEPRRVVSGEFDIWMPDSRARNEATRFLRPTPDTTLTIPSTASRLIAVGAYDSRRMTYASFSGRGRDTEPFYIRPDLAAPGVDLTTTAPGGGYTIVSGTSFATPFVTGAAALLMEWGIIKGNDPYLYGEKLRASLNRGARQLTAEENYPNPRLGYGALCVRDSLPLKSNTLQ